ncbi:MAG: hypothetical protein LBD41_02180, partial [Clostridiales Family XIII bacterium]|nr:hypothetical protein [Clostridiales Family XIII bacterium]
MNRKKIIAFDQDDTLNITKLPLNAKMANLLEALLIKYKVLIISGTNFEVMKKNNIDLLSSKHLDKLHIMPTNGTQYYKYENGNWNRIYRYFLTKKQIERASDLLKNGMKKFNFWIENPAGEIIENRQSQITMSALGQWAKPEDKHK